MCGGPTYFVSRGMLQGLVNGIDSLETVLVAFRLGQVLLRLGLGQVICCQRASFILACQMVSGEQGAQLTEQLH
jgi:hypothetical protein